VICYHHYELSTELWSKLDLLIPHFISMIALQSRRTNFSARRIEVYERRLVVLDGSVN
jgi:hypothetical protein